MDKKKSFAMIVVLIVIFIGLVIGIGVFKSNSDVVINNDSDNVKKVSIEKLYSEDEIFTERDLKQEADLTEAQKYEVSNDIDINITSEGVYVLSGTAENVTINIEAGDDEKVQLVLDNLSITNKDKECIHVENADKVFITTNTQSSLTYYATDIENATASILSRSDIVFNGKGTLTINSDNNGINGKDDLKITGGTYNITSTKNCIRANDSIRIAGGTFNLKSGTDGLHAENNDDDSKGYIFINSCILNIESSDDGIHATSDIQIDGGTINVIAAEGIEGTYIQINGGTIFIEASDDGINAAQKSSFYQTPTVVINDGNIKIVMGAGDTDGIDSNGDIIVNGGTVDITGNSTFDYDGKAEHNGGKIIVNGKETETIPNQFMGGMPGERGGEVPPQNMNGEFNNKMFKPNTSGDFKGEKPSRDFRKNEI